MAVNEAGMRLISSSDVPLNGGCGWISAPMPILYIFFLHSTEDLIGSPSAGSDRGLEQVAGIRVKKM